MVAFGPEEVFFLFSSSAALKSAQAELLDLRCKYNQDMSNKYVHLASVSNAPMSNPNHLLKKWRSKEFRVVNSTLQNGGVGVRAPARLVSILLAA